MADLILAIHLAFVAFVVGGLVAIWVGASRGSAWAFSRTFRALHLAAIAVVVAESLLGFPCPLTAWEDALRGVQQDTGFIARLLRCRALLEPARLDVHGALLRVRRAGGVDVAQVSAAPAPSFFFSPIRLSSPLRSFTMLGWCRHSSTASIAIEA